MIIIIPTIKYGSTSYNTFTMGVCSNYHGHFFLLQCAHNADLHSETSTKPERQNQTAREKIELQLILAAHKKNCDTGNIE